MTKPGIFLIQRELEGRLLIQLLSEGGSQQIARANFYADDRGAWVFNVLVHEPFRRMKMGRMLLEGIATYLRDPDKTISFKVDHDNEVALKFYSSLGFKRTGVLQNSRGAGLDEVVMEARIRNTTVAPPTLHKWTYQITV